MRDMTLAEVAMQEAVSAIRLITDPTPSDDSSIEYRKTQAAEAMTKAIVLTVEEMARVR